MGSPTRSATPSSSRGECATSAAVRGQRGRSTGRLPGAARQAGGPLLFGVVESIASYRWTTAALRRMLLEASSAMTEQVEALQGLDEDQRALTSHVA